MTHIKNIFSSYKADLPAGLVVFLVALPLCLGIALASGAPLFAGVLSGVIGGIVVGYLSDSNISVSGPAAGLTVIVMSGIASFGSYEVFLVTVVLVGIMQLTLGYLKAGIIGHFFPVSVINGMLTAIGLSIILKQIPHAFGYDLVGIDEAAFADKYGHNSLSELYYMLQGISSGAIIISIVSLLIIFWWNKITKTVKFLKVLPAPLAVVFWGIGANLFFKNFIPSLYLNTSHLVALPSINNWGQFVGELRFPDLSALANPQVYILAITIAIVASLESLLSLEASDKIDPEKRISSPNKELKAQGIGNIIAGLIGGIPVTAVIVRSSANANSGAKSKLSAIFHGTLLLVSVLFLAQVLNLIPLAALSAILIHVGVKLNKPAIYKRSFKAGSNQFIPFTITTLSILLTNLLLGIVIGVLVGLGFVLYSNFRSGVITSKIGDKHIVQITRNLYFFNKAQIRKVLHDLPDNSTVLLDGTKIDFLDYDIRDSLVDFIETSKSRNIDVILKKSQSAAVDIFKAEPLTFNQANNPTNKTVVNL